MTPHEKVLSRLTDEIKKDIPGFDLISKEKSGFMKFLNFFVQLFNRTFLTHYFTTIAPKVYTPSSPTSKIPHTMWPVLAHEWHHLREAKRLSTPLWAFRYLLPQVLFPLALLSILAVWFGPWWLLNLAWLLVLAPIPAYWRKKEELEAYTITLAIMHWRTGRIGEYSLATVAKQFYGSGYYFMWPFKKAISEQLVNEVTNIQAGKYDNVFPHSKIKEIIEEELKSGS